MNQRNYFIVDAETDGLDGSFLSIAAAVYNEEWSCLDEFYSAIDNATSDNPWVQQNVLPHLSRATKHVASEELLLKDFFAFWSRHREDSQIYTDIPCPVEARLFSRCLEAAHRPALEYPHPIIDLASVLLKAGYDPNVNRECLIHDTYLKHDAMQDVKTTAEVLKQIFPPPQKSDKPYSYHTFIFPFLFDNNSTVTRAEFTKHLDPSRWKLEDGVAEHSNDFKNSYNQFHYFNSATQNAIYTHKGQENIVANYKYIKEDRYVEYVIRKATGDKVFEYRLKVNDIRLRLFNTNVGMLQFELENFGYSTPDDICRINEYGRRIYPPYLKGNASSYFCDGVADEIQLIDPGVKTFASSPIRAYEEGSPDETRLIDPITELLSSRTRKVTTNKPLRKDEFYIEPIVDDRMFVACFYDSDHLVHQMGQWQEDDYRFMKDSLRLCPDHPANLGALLYRLIFVDCDWPTCQSRTLMHELLKKHSYTRWLEWGTLSGISEYSMISISDNPPDHIVDAFLIEYVEMLVLVLAQRASLLVFERRLSDASLGRAKIREIQRDYTRFQSQLLLQEITPQQQGIELYDMLRDILFINKEQQDIEKQIKNLFDQDENETTNRQNIILFFVALISLFDLTDVIASWLSNAQFFAPFVNLLKSIGFASWGIRASFLAVLLIIAIIFYFCRPRSKRKPRLKQRRRWFSRKKD